ncbi:AMP-binding protein [Amycolatopsis tucumanensis]|uniref:AMP-binding protein n=1 Tax=Amycolatopsis tucumanensis TaxID=401106 RepID=A0ABP7JW43_9PSEU|nr:AMP-binding protein [Amycolatopsis tucumanensis]MCF6427696.1 non-ribosomal peptide synthetase [Amycolatopsis tucumanensis]
MDSQVAPRGTPNQESRVGFAHSLRSFGVRTALVGPDGTTLTYDELTRRVDEAIQHLGPVRRLVLLTAAHDLDTVVTYLACLRAGHPVLLTSSEPPDTLIARYDPDVVVREPKGYAAWEERRTGSAHVLHPDLAVLLSTSGSTGSPKLVRLSAANLQSNATAIADYLDIRSDDRAVLSLPLNYCYGLSIINSNLVRGATVLLTAQSVVDPGFWNFVRRHRATSLHGVPYTFELLDHIEFERLQLPHLRYVTQAGGRLPPETVRRYAQLGRRDGWRFFVMYGQTEATARMSYLPPELATSRPGTIGHPIPGGRFEIRSDTGGDVGELIYHGPNVMLGYAEGPADLALGRTVDELATGDIARRCADGLYEVVGRRSRFVKVFGHRVDLDVLERRLRESGQDTACTGNDEYVVVAVPGTGAPDRVRALASAHTGLPAHRIHVRVLSEFPRLSSGKIDYPAILRGACPPEPAARSVRQALATVVNRQDVSDKDTFVSLGGDSMSYVQMTLALERLLGHVPPDWHVTPVRVLENRVSVKRATTVETDIVLRALAIIFVVGTHVGLFRLLGGAHLLLVIAGWNFARFALADRSRNRTSANLLRSAARIAVPAVAWIGWRAASQPDVLLPNVLLINNYVRQGATGYWYVEVLVQTLVVLAIVFAVPAVRRLEQRHPFGFPAAALAVATSARLLVDDTSGFPERAMSIQGTVWFFALGWAAQRATCGWHKLVVLGTAMLLVSDYFFDPRREALILAGLLLLVLTPRLPLPKPLARTAGLLAGASLYIYLTHYAVYPALLPYLPPAAVVAACLGAGLAAWLATGLLTRRWTMLRHTRTVTTRR